MAIIGEEIEGYVQNQITARQTLHGSGVGHTGNLRIPQQINLLNSNTSWIKLASGASISEARLKNININDTSNLKDMGLAKNNILFSGTSKLINGQLEQREGFLPRDVNSSYTYGSFGFSPMPGIISADIKTLTRGSLKKATVKLIANNKQQFDIIDLLYMRLGYTVLFEWGNSIYTTNGENKKTLGNTLIEDKFFESSGNDSYFTFLDDIEDKRRKHNGNYDALLGKISNFNWSFNPDGSYSIELTIISLGDVIESLKSNLSVDKITNEFLKRIIPQSTSTESSVVNIIDGGIGGTGGNEFFGTGAGQLKGNKGGGDNGDWGGSLPKLISILPAGTWHAGSQKRGKKTTKSGNTSDHFTGQTHTYAGDFGLNSTFGGDKVKATNFAIAVAQNAGGTLSSWTPYVGKTFTINSGGYRVQVIWQSMVGGNHYDHVHVGVKKL